MKKNQDFDLGFIRNFQIILLEEILNRDKNITNHIILIMCHIFRSYNFCLIIRFEAGFIQFLTFRVFY